MALSSLIIKIKENTLFRLTRIVFIASGFFFIVCLILAFTTIPFQVYHWLGTSKSELTDQPGHIILMGGGGMPSQSVLMRCWYTEKAAKEFPSAEIIIATPGDVRDSTDTPFLIREELTLRGIRNIVQYETEGTNTRSQALNCKAFISMKSPLLIVTSPEHMRRAVLCFRKAGFENTYALPAFESTIKAELRFDDDKLGGNKYYIPDVGKNINVRYQLWTHLKYEILIAREFIALAYYRLRGWI